MNELLDGPGWMISEAVRSRQVSATDIARAALERVGADTLGAVWTVTEQRALREAAAVDAAVAAGRIPSDRVLLGVPVGWKDLIDTGGTTSTYGSAVFRDHVPERDAEVVERFTAAGSVTVAKLATHELAWGTTTQNPHFGSCRNPHDPTRVPGGSSGGSGPHWRQGSWPRHPAPTPAARSAARPRAAAWSASSPRSAGSAWRASIRSASASITAARWRAPCATARSSSRR